MKFLVTNDDGFGAPGILALEQAARRSGQALVLAPHAPLSGCGHQVTTHRPLRVRRDDEFRFALDGTPADCVRVGLGHLAADADWVLSGINAGGNLGADVFISGTVAAVREAALLGRKAVAFSHYFKRQMPVDWPTAGRWVEAVLALLVARPLPVGHYWNVNLPHLPADSPCPEIVFCALDCHPLPVQFRIDDDLFHYEADYHQRPRHTDRDIAVCFSGRISVTELSLG